MSNGMITPEEAVWLKEHLAEKVHLDPNVGTLEQLHMKDLCNRLLDACIEEDTDEFEAARQDLNDYLERFRLH